MYRLSHSETETEQMGTSLAPQLRAGDVLLLRGELGAGKTAFVRGLAKGLGILEAVSSPTFTLMHVYDGEVPLHHLDLYRLSDADEFYAAGLDDAVGRDAIAVIEWPEMAEAALPEMRLVIALSYGEMEGERRLTATPEGGFREVEWA